MEFFGENFFEKKFSPNPFQKTSKNLAFALGVREDSEFCLYFNKIVFGKVGKPFLQKGFPKHKRKDFSPDPFSKAFKQCEIFEDH